MVDVRLPTVRSHLKLSAPNRHTVIALLLVAVAAAGAWTSGAVRPATAVLIEIARGEVESCMAEDGQAYPVGGVEVDALDRNDPVALSYDACLAAVIRVDRFSDLGLETPSSQYARLKTDGYAWWRCVEDAGYTRTTGIPLSSEKGYPLAVRAGHFTVGPSDQDLLDFYETAATCGDRPLDQMKDRDGSYSRGLADGRDCDTHEHDGSQHAHGCFWAEEGD
jgi:hypothetical protein